MKRTLRLKREPLAELGGADLVRVVGGTTTDRPTWQISCMEVESCFMTGCCIEVE